MAGPMESDPTLVSPRRISRTDFPQPQPFSPIIPPRENNLLSSRASSLSSTTPLDSRFVAAHRLRRMAAPPAHLLEHGSMHNGGVNIQNGLSTPHGPMNGGHHFDASRSPPNTSHVPCKFFMQGTCQAGNRCPFSHNLGTSSEQTCKYFTKGNCKFGAKCANVHILPNGMRVDYDRNGIQFRQPAVHLGNRVPPVGLSQISNSNLTRSFQGAVAGPVYTATNGFNDHGAPQPNSRPLSQGSGMPTVDTTQYTDPISPYDSPRGTDDICRFGVGMPSTSGGPVISLLDVQLPASFDSNGISHAARYGPWPASLPANFMQPSPTPSLSSAREGRAVEAVRALRSSAYPEHSISRSAVMGSSPPNMAMRDDIPDRRTTMHSNNSKYARPRTLDSNADRVDEDWAQELLFQEEDYIPESLANEVLTPAENARRGSSRDLLNGTDYSTMEANSAEPTDVLPSAFGTSPSRWGSFFQKQRVEEEAGTMSNGRSPRNSSAFGHVGSPLRTSSLANGMADTNDASPPAISSISALTQQIQQTRIGEQHSSGPLLHPNSARSITYAKAANGALGRGKDRLERHLSSGSTNSSSNNNNNTNKLATPVDEGDACGVFFMDSDEAARPNCVGTSSGTKAAPNGWN